MREEEIIEKLMVFIEEEKREHILFSSSYEEGYVNGANDTLASLKALIEEIK